MALFSPGSVPWLLRHVLRIFAREGTTGKQKAWMKALLIVSLLAGGHWLGYYAALLLRQMPPGPGWMLGPLTVVALLAWVLMVSHAINSTAQNLYARGDTQLLLSSPVSFRRVVIVRALALGITVAMVYVMLAMPIANMLAIMVDPAWLSIYPVIAGLGLGASGVGIALCLGLFALFGPRRARAVVQIFSALLSVAIIVALQAHELIPKSAIDVVSRWFSAIFGAAFTDPTSMLWIASRALNGRLPDIAIVLGGGLATCGLSALLLGRRYAATLGETAGAAAAGTRKAGGPLRIASRGPRGALRRKELMVLRRDPWLISQIGLQTLALLPLFLVLLKDGSGEMRITFLAATLVILIGQIAGALAWITLNGEDAPDLIAAAPLSATDAARAKLEALALIVLPIILVSTLLLMRWSYANAATGLLGMLFGATASALIQVWSPVQARRKEFALRYKTGKMNSLLEIAILVAAAAATGLGANGQWWALIPAVVGPLLLALRYLTRAGAG